MTTDKYYRRSSLPWDRRSNEQADDLGPLEHRNYCCVCASAGRALLLYGLVSLYYFTSGREQCVSICARVCVCRSVGDHTCLDLDPAWLALDHAVGGLLALDLAHPQQLHVEDQGRAGRDLVLLLVTVPVLRRDGHDHLLPRLNAVDDRLPSGDDLALTQAELEGALAVVRRVELCAVEQIPCVVHVHVLHLPGL